MYHEMKILIYQDTDEADHATCKLHFRKFLPITSAIKVDLSADSLIKFSLDFNCANNYFNSCTRVHESTLQKDNLKHKIH